MGVSKLFALSNGEVIAPVNSFKNLSGKISKSPKEIKQEKENSVQAGKNKKLRSRKYTPK
ncbi:hypothetical protein [Zooshikella ganghwensis]|uniref:hypothetical protein n=1 Tax=Zooshikella ganghwensis TaxID=202772 RepID=UPI00197F2FDB|nr:hypothetical protein [Zooshikella ganghwensis]